MSNSQTTGCIHLAPYDGLILEVASLDGQARLDRALDHSFVGASVIVRG